MPDIACTACGGVHDSLEDEVKCLTERLEQVLDDRDYLYKHSQRMQEYLRRSREESRQLAESLLIFDREGFVERRDEYGKAYEYKWYYNNHDHYKLIHSMHLAREVMGRA